MKNIDKKQTDNLDFEIQFYEEILKEQPDFIQALVVLADAYTKKGYYEKGLKIDKRLAKLKPDDPMVFYNLCCSYSLLKMNDLAFEALKKAIALGYEDFDYILTDKDLDNLRKDKRFFELINKFTNSKSFK